MRDIVVLIFLVGCIIAALKKPWWGVLSLAIFSYMNPHAYAWGFVRTLPVYYVLFLVVAFRTFTTKDKQPIPSDWRVKVFILLWLYFFITTTVAYVPDIAWDRFWFVTKIYIPFYFTLVLINTREKLYYLIATIGLSIGIVALKGGIFAIMTGFGHRVYGPPSSLFGGNNEFAVAMLISIPLLLIWRNETTNALIKKGLLYSIPIIFIASISSWSRGALLTMTGLTLMLVWHSKRKFFAIPLAIVGTGIAINFLPQEWFGRMETLETYNEDASAMGRIVVWIDGWNHTLSHPFTGTGFEGWIWITERDWHSSYVEMFAEHGFVAFALWLSLIFGTLFSLTSLPGKVKNITGMEWVSNYCYMIRASIVCYMIGTAFLGLAYWDLLYHLIFISALLKKFANEEFLQKQKMLNPIKIRSLTGRISKTEKI